MNDREFEKLLKTIDADAVPPEGLKEKLLFEAMASEHRAQAVLTPFERFIFENPMRAACFISIPISGSLWAVMGSNFAKLLAGVLG